jgi:hypothetical protein
MIDLALPLALVVDINWLIGTVVTGLGGSGAGVRFLWKYWVNREKEKREAWQKVVADKDVLIAKKDQALADLSTKNDTDMDNLRKEKDAEIIRLGKELSKKSDDHAVKVEELMNMALAEVKGVGMKVEGLLDRALNVQAEFTAEVRALRISPGTGEVNRPSPDQLRPGGA